MGWFSPVKGHYPSLAQVDKTLPVKAGVSKIERGTIVTLEADTGSKEGVWNVANASTTKLFYVALQDYTDPTAGFAGDKFNPDPSKTVSADVPHAAVPGQPRITALDLSQDGEYETTVFEDGDYAVGSAVYVSANGKLTATGSGTAIGYVTLGKTERWINNAIAVPVNGDDPRLAVRTGANKMVIRFKTGA